MNRITLFQELAKWKGRRNTVITLIVPSNTKIGPVVEAIRRRVQAIRHINKQQQILQTVDLISESIHSQSGSTGLVICAGFDLQGNSIYRELEPTTKITEQEYYYDYTFNLTRIKQLLWAEVFYTPRPNHHQLMARLFTENSPRLIIGEDQIQTAIRDGTIQFLQTDRDVDPETLDALTQTGAHLIVIEPREGVLNRFGLSWPN